MRMLLIVGILLTTSKLGAQDEYATDRGYIGFFSKAPISDVDASNDNAKFVLDRSTGGLEVNASMADFRFKNKKMGRDAEKSYLEAVKYPAAGFKGKISGDIDYKRPGTYPATAVGKLTIHGVTKNIKEEGTVVVTKGSVTLKSEFFVRLKDFNIERPTILGREMTEDKVLVKIDATLVERSNVARKK